MSLTLTPSRSQYINLQTPTFISLHFPIITNVRTYYPSMSDITKLQVIKILKDLIICKLSRIFTYHTFTADLTHLLPPHQH